MTMNVYNDVREVARIGWGGGGFPAQVDWAKKSEKVTEIACRGGGGVFRTIFKRKKKKIT